MSTVDGGAGQAVTGEERLSVGALFARLSEDTSRLVKDELRLAQAELRQKGKAAGLGVGLLAGAGMAAFLGLCGLLAAAAVALALVMAAWLAALAVGAALVVIAGGLAMAGRSRVSRALPPVPAEAVGGMKEDVQTAKAVLHR